MTVDGVPTRSWPDTDRLNAVDRSKLIAESSAELWARVRRIIEAADVCIAAPERVDNPLGLVTTTPLREHTWQQRWSAKQKREA